MVEKVYKFAIDKVERLNLDEYPDDEFAVARLGFLSSAPNSHGLEISDETLRENASSALGKFVVAKIFLGDTKGHENNQSIFGYIPKEQEIEFFEEDGYIRASCLAVISKVYSEEFCNILERDGEKSVSVEMKVMTPEDDEKKVLSFRIFGVTVLGERIAPSCPNSTIGFVRFSEEKANDFYNKIHKNTESQLRQFAENRRKQFMAETKTYKVDKSKEAISEKSWGEVDKAELRKRIMDASNRTSLVKDVYMIVEDGWEDSPSEHLKYPVMCFEGDTLVYNRYGLASALGYAEKENETAVITKVEKIYKKLGLESEGKEEGKKMSKEINFAAVDIGDMWAKIWSVLRSHDNWRYSIEGIYEEDNKKFAVLRTEDGTLYRMDFSLTEEGMEASDKLVEVKKEFIDTENIVKFAEPENVEKYTKFEDEEEEKEDEEDDEGEKEHEEEMSAEDMKSKMAQLEADIESRDHIIMEKDQELEMLRRFKADIENKEKAMSVEAVMADVKDCFDETQFSELRDEGLACTMEGLDGWSNKVKAMAFSAVAKEPKANPYVGVFTFAAPANNLDSKPKSVWDRLKNQ